MPERNPREIHIVGGEEMPSQPDLTPGPDSTGAPAVRIQEPADPFAAPPQHRTSPLVDPRVPTAPTTFDMEGVDDVRAAPPEPIVEKKTKPPHILLQMAEDLGIRKERATVMHEAGILQDEIAAWSSMVIAEQNKVIEGHRAAAKTEDVDPEPSVPKKYELPETVDADIRSAFKDLGERLDKSEANVAETARAKNEEVFLQTLDKNIGALGEGFEAVFGKGATNVQLPEDQWDARTRIIESISDDMKANHARGEPTDLDEAFRVAVFRKFPSAYANMAAAKTNTNITDQLKDRSTQFLNRAGDLAKQVPKSPEARAIAAVFDIQQRDGLLESDEQMLVGMPD